MNLYTMEAVENAVADMARAGAEVYVVPGSLIDTYIVLPTERYAGFIAREKGLNEWSSAYTVRRFAKISRRISDIIEAVESENYDLAENLIYA